MKITNIEQNTEAWEELRKGKITGSKDIIVKRGEGRKIAFYQLLADKLATVEDTTDPMERGHELETEALTLFLKATGKKLVTNVFCQSDENESIALSPDALVEGNEEAVEVKCLNSAAYLKSYFEQAPPKEYEDQIIQYFVVNEQLKTLYFVMYDPRITVKPIFWLEIKREDIADKIEYNKKEQLKLLAEAEELLTQIAF